MDMLSGEDRPSGAGQRPEAVGGEEAQGGPRVTANQTRRKSLLRTVHPGKEVGRRGRGSPGDLHLPSWITEQEET